MRVDGPMLQQAVDLHVSGSCYIIDAPLAGACATLYCVAHVVDLVYLI